MANFPKSAEYLTFSKYKLFLCSQNLGVLDFGIGVSGSFSILKLPHSLYIGGCKNARGVMKPNRSVLSY